MDLTGNRTSEVTSETSGGLFLVTSETSKKKDPLVEVKSETHFSTNRH